jgi:hypothetical protein
LSQSARLQATVGVVAACSGDGKFKYLFDAEQPIKEMMHHFPK